MPRGSGLSIYIFFRKVGLHKAKSHGKESNRWHIERSRDNQAGDGSSKVYGTQPQYLRHQSDQYVWDIRVYFFYCGDWADTYYGGFAELKFDSRQE